MSPAVDLYQLLEQLHAIARSGLAFTDSPYDRERYDQLLALIEPARAQALDLAPAELRAALAAEVGYITPKLGAEVAVFDPEGRLLVVQMPSGAWALPGGFVDPGESAAQAAVREAREETGMEVELGPLLDLYFRPASAHTSAFSLVVAVYLATAVAGEPSHSHEHVGIGYRAIDEVEAWRGRHEDRARDAHALWTRLGGAQP